MLVHSALALASASALLVAAHADPASPHRLVRRAPAADEPSTTTVAAAATKTHKVAAAAAADSTVTAVATTNNAQIKAAAQSALPLTQYTYAYDQVPYQVNPYPSVRGPQSGYNQCNSTTEGDDAMCQTLIANDIKDFCLWGSDLTGTELDTIGDIEAAVVSYCTQKGHGGRTIKAGAVTGVQVLKTEAYIQWTGFIDQTALHLTADDSGGELDPHGADLQGNPLGGLVYSSGLPSGDNKTLEQAVEWNLFIGGGVFCLKLCDPEYYKKTGVFFCENRYDRMGCSYNMPASYVDKEFSVCDSELQDVVGVYTGADGKTSTYSQPPEGTAPNPPYDPRVPKSSNCQTYASTDLFEAVSTSAASSSATGSASGAAMTGSASGSMSAGASQSSGAGTAASQGAGGNSAAAPTTGSGAAMWLASSGFVALVAGALAVLA